MQIKLLQLIPAALVFILSCCQSATLPPESKESLDNLSIVEPTPLPAPEAPSPVPSEYWNVDEIDVSEIDPARKLIAFTFDDAPARTMENILAVFAAFNESNPLCKASATFFFNGKRFDGQTTHLLYAACALGCELGNHTHSHKDLTTLSEEELRDEIERTDERLAAVDNRPFHLLRAPFGRIDERVKALSPTPIIDWTIDTLDWTGVDENAIHESVFNGRFSGAIVLMHDGYEHTVSALKRLLPDLAADGYQVVSVSKMIKAHGCRFKKGSVYIRARKQK